MLEPLYWGHAGKAPASRLECWPDRH